MELKKTAGFEWEIGAFRIKQEREKGFSIIRKKTGEYVGTVNTLLEAKGKSEDLSIGMCVLNPLSIFEVMGLKFK
jgi:hypothetical protein